MNKTLFILILLPGVLCAQADQQQDLWSPFNFFAGKWEGTGNGQPGVSTVEREYQFVLNGKFLQARNKSVYKPQEQNPK
ncbi:MAG: hypothetical protein AAB316_06575, partial [Bacteroidota bacterium]